MTDPVRELKIRAEILQRELSRRRPSAVWRLRTLPEFRASSSEQLAYVGPQVLRRQCLALLAIELGFSGWPHAKQVMSGARGVSDFGTLLYPRGCGGHLNLWYSRYDEAVAGRRASGGFLLAYRRDFLVVERSFIETLGLDPDHADWLRLGFDWVRPIDMRARTRLYGELVQRMPHEAQA